MKPKVISLAALVAVLLIGVMGPGQGPKEWTWGHGAWVTTIDIVDGTIDQVDIDDTDTIADNPAHGAGAAWFGTTGLIFEGNSNDFEGLLKCANIGSDMTWTLPLETGTILTDATAFVGDITGDADATVIASPSTLYNAEVGAGGAVTGPDGTYAVADTEWVEIYDQYTEFANGAGDDEFCYSGAGLSNVIIRADFSFSSDAAGAALATFVFGIAATAVANGDETGEIMVRVHDLDTANESIGGSLQILTSLAKNDCVALLFDNDNGDDVIVSNGTVTVTR